MTSKIYWVLPCPKRDFYDFDEDPVSFSREKSPNLAVLKNLSKILDWDPETNDFEDLKRFLLVHISDKIFTKIGIRSI